MKKILISIPDRLVARMRAAIPPRQRSKAIALLLEKEIERREKSLYECAMAVEEDKALRDEMKDWGITLSDGLDNEQG